MDFSFPFIFFSQHSLSRRPFHLSLQLNCSIDVLMVEMGSMCYEDTEDEKITIMVRGNEDESEPERW